MYSSVSKTAYGISSHVQMFILHPVYANRESPDAGDAGDAGERGREEGDCNNTGGGSGGSSGSAVCYRESPSATTHQDPVAQLSPTTKVRRYDDSKTFSEDVFLISTSFFIFDYVQFCEPKDFDDKM